MHTTVRTQPRPSARRARSVRDALRLARQVEAGLPYEALTRFQRESGFSLGAVADLVRIPRRTLLRRKARRRLAPDESERLLRIASIFDQALELFEGDAAAAGRWLQSPKRALAGMAPLDCARTELGAREVAALIERLEHGTFV